MKSVIGEMTMNKEYRTTRHSTCPSMSS